MNTAGGCPAFLAARLIRASSVFVTRNVGVTVRASVGAAGGTIVLAMADRRTPRGSPQPTARGTVAPMDQPLDAARLAAIAPLLDDPVLRVLAAWPLARMARCTARDRALGASELCGWAFSRDRLARLSGVTTLQLERAIDLLESAQLVDDASGDVVPEVAALMRRELGARLRR